MKHSNKILLFIVIVDFEKGIIDLHLKFQFKANVSTKLTKFALNHVNEISKKMCVKICILIL